MGLPGKACLYGIVLTLVIACSPICGCICGLSPSEDPAAGDNLQPDDMLVPGESPGASILEAEDVNLSTPTPGPTPSPRPSVFTIYVEGGKDHQPGETLRLYGMDTCSNALYLFVSGTTAPVCGGRLDNLQQPVVDGDPSTFTRVNVSDDGSWEYFWTAPGGQPALLFDLYNVIATTEPRDKPHLDEAPAWDMVIVKIGRYQS